MRACVRASVRVGVAGTDQEGKSIITCSLGRSYFPYKSFGFMLCVGVWVSGGREAAQMNIHIILGTVVNRHCS